VNQKDVINIPPAWSPNQVRSVDNFKRKSFYLNLM